MNHLPVFILILCGGAADYDVSIIIEHGDQVIIGSGEYFWAVSLFVNTSTNRAENFILILVTFVTVRPLF
jgi:hypothetical protein